MEITNLLDKKHTFAIIGASNTPEKYGYKIFKQLKTLGYEVYPINNKDSIIQGQQAYKSLNDLPIKVDVLNFIVPPEVSFSITKDALSLGYKTFWYQPGSFNDEIIKLHDGKGTDIINNFCLLIESARQ